MTEQTQQSAAAGSGSKKTLVRCARLFWYGKECAARISRAYYSRWHG